MKNHYVTTHMKKSREVTAADTERMIKQAFIMYDMCNDPPEGHAPAFAIAHSQIDDKDPLRFFVTNAGEIIINPIITRHTNTKIMVTEGCTSYPRYLRHKKVARHYRCEVTFHGLDEDKNWLPKTEKIKGKIAQIYQHEIDHMNGIYIYTESA